jgi:hypothetical protein
MRAWHLILILILGYALGVLWPGPGQKVKSAVTGG